MATWIAHLRIAEELGKRWQVEDELAFWIGNLGPDSGVMNQTTKAFEPPSEVSHWQTGPYKDSIDPEAFYQAYLTEEWDSFYLGYYVHLICDIIWDKEVGVPMRRRFAEGLKNPEFIWEIKRDWYAHDNHFLRDNPDWPVLKSVCATTQFPNRYLDYYPLDAFEGQIKYICNYYHTYQFPYRSFDYLSRDEYEAYLASAIRQVDDALREHQKTA